VERWLKFETIFYHRVILRDFSPEEPALSEVEGSGAQRTKSSGGVSASRQILHGLKAVQDDALIRESRAGGKKHVEIWRRSCLCRTSGALAPTSELMGQQMFDYEPETAYG
jgi:hypothetical protein